MEVTIMKHIRKIIVAILAIAVVATTAIVPAMAEGNIPQTNNQELVHQHRD